VSAGVATARWLPRSLPTRAKPDGLLAVAPGKKRHFLLRCRLAPVGHRAKTQSAFKRFRHHDDRRTRSTRRPRNYVSFSARGFMKCAISRVASIPRRVEPERETKSISTEETFEYDVRDESRLVDLLRIQGQRARENLTLEGSSAQTVAVKVKRADLRS